MAMPTSAAASAGASFTPSPTIATGPYARAQRRDRRDFVAGQQLGVRFVETRAPRPRSALAAHITGQQHDALDALLAKAGDRRPARPSRMSVGEPDDAERRAGMAHEHRRGAALLDFLDARVERRRAKLPIFEQPVTADDRRRRGNRRLGAEARQRAERRAGRNDQAGDARAVHDRAADRMLGSRLERRGDFAARRGRGALHTEHIRSR